MPAKFSIYGPMISASGDAAARTYKTYVGKSGRRWCVADQKNAADNIYVDGGPNSRGMAGRTLTFELTEGGSVRLQGPWKTTSENLFDDTGVDVRDTYTSIGIVARYMEPGSVYGADFYVGVLHQDHEPIIGPFDRIEKIAQCLANQVDAPVYMGVVTRGGGSAKRVSPQTSGDNDG